jgi:hypothetical protein
MLTRYTFGVSTSDALYNVARALGTATRLDRTPTLEQVQAGFLALTAEQQQALLQQLRESAGIPEPPAQSAAEQLPEEERAGRPGRGKR